MANKYIFGSGISALIFKKFNSEYEIISPDEKVGGQLTKHKNLLTTFYIHNTPETKSLLDELKIKYKEKRLRIYYYYFGKLLENLTKEQKINIIKNKLKEWSYDSNSCDIDNLVLSTDNTYLDILDCKVEELIDKLTPESYTRGSVKLINNNRQFFIYKDEKGELITEKYDTLISSIPANIFFPLMYNYKRSYYLNYLPVTFIASKNKPRFIKEDAIYYVCNDTLCYNRCQPYGDSGYIYECTGIIDDETIEKQIGGVISVERRYVGILKDEEINNFNNIKFIGRNALWNSNIKIQDVIKYAKEFRRSKNDKV